MELSDCGMQLSIQLVLVHTIEKRVSEGKNCRQMHRSLGIITANRCKGEIYMDNAGRGER